MTRVRELQIEGRRRLAGRVPTAPGREASRLLAHLLGVGEASLAAIDERDVSPEVERGFLELVARRAAGEPAAYLTGRREFFGRDFEVDRRVLVPRPETEHLVEIALALPLPSEARVLDVGAGSGALAVTLAVERPAWRVAATDLSLAALAVASRNAARLAPAARIGLVAVDLASAIDLRAFDLVVSNPPYVDPDDTGSLSADVREHEPSLALFARPGTSLLEALIAAGESLALGAYLALEVGAGQASSLLDLARESGLYDRFSAAKDLAGFDRNVVLRRGAHGGARS